jgi:hypothetical protein
LKKLLTSVLLALCCIVAQSQTKPRTQVVKLRSALAPVGTSFTSMVVTWQYTPNAPACPSTGTLSNCINGFNTTIVVGGVTVYSASSGYATGNLGPTALGYTWTPTSGVGFGNYTITVTTVGYDGSGNVLLSAPATATLSVNLTALNPPTNITVTGK